MGQMAQWGEIRNKWMKQKWEWSETKYILYLSDKRKLEGTMLINKYIVHG